MKVFKVGDRIRIRKDLSEENSYLSSFGINDSMETLRGRTAVIIKAIEIRGQKNPIRMYRYFLDVDDGKWTWGIDMFDLANNILELE